MKGQMKKSWKYVSFVVVCTVFVWLPRKHSKIDEHIGKLSSFSQVPVYLSVEFVSKYFVMLASLKPFIVC